MLEGEFRGTFEIYQAVPSLVPRPYGCGRLRQAKISRYFLLSDFTEMKEGLLDPIELCKCIASLQQKSMSSIGKFGSFTTCHGKIPLTARSRLGQQPVLLHEAPTGHTPKGPRNQWIITTARASLLTGLGQGDSSASRSPGIKRPLRQTGLDPRRLMGRQHRDTRSYWLHSFSSTLLPTGLTARWKSGCGDVNGTHLGMRDTRMRIWSRCPRASRRGNGMTGVGSIA